MAVSYRSKSRSLPPEEPRRKNNRNRKDTSAPTIDLRSWTFLIRERLVLIIACISIAVGGAVYYLSKAPKIYTAKGSIEVLPEAQRVLNDVKSFNPEASGSAEAVRTVENALKSQSLMLRVAKKNDLRKIHPRFKWDAKTGQDLTDSDVVEGMLAKLTVAQRRGSKTIEVFVDDTDPIMAAKLTQSIMDEYISTRDEQQLGTQDEAIVILEKQRGDFETRLRNAENELQKLRQKHNTTDIDKNESTLKAQLEDINKQLTLAKTERVKLEGDLPILRHRSELTMEQLLALESVAKQPDVEESQKKIITAEAEFGSAKKVYLENHPKYKRAEITLKEYKDSLDKAVRKAATMFANSFEKAKLTEDALDKAVREQKEAAVKLSEIAIPFRSFSATVDDIRKSLSELNERIAQLRISSKVAARNVLVSESSIVPTLPSKPVALKVIALAVAAGIGIAVTLIILLKAFDNTILSIDQAETELSLPVLAAVPQAKGKASKAQLVISDYPASREAEAFRCLRTAVSLANSDGMQKVILFTSAVPAEGKSYCSSNYAAALAQQGLRTLLIDCDLRRPALGRVFPTKKDANGITDFLTGKSKFDECWHVTEVSKLYFMPAGTKNANPAELLSGEVVAKILKEAARKFDRVIIDSAPVNAVSDTLLLAEHVDAVVFVVRARSTPVRATVRALQQLQQANGTPYGIVLNRLPSRGANYYYYDEGSYHSKGVYGA